MSKVEFVWATSQGENIIVDLARVSNPDNQGNYETGPRLLRYLTKHEHWSPCEMANLCVKINTERDIAAQIIRHRSFSFQEFSTRYAKTGTAEVPRFRRQDEKNRQNSFDDIHETHQEDFQTRAGYAISQSFRVYESLLKAGVAKETARRILPLCTPTVIYMNGTVRSWIHYLKLRTKTDTQLEHRQVAEGCLRVFKDCYPVVHEAVFGEG